MADPSPYTTKPHFPFSTIQPKPINKSKSFSHFIFKVLFFTLFIIAVSLFPSQAPHFVNQTLFTKFWELIHLLFIGIAVAYGLFSTRNVEHEVIEVETESSVVVGSASYVSKMFPVWTNFNENENTFGFDEKRVMHSLNPPNGGNVGVFDEQYKTQLPISEDNFDCSVGFGATNVVQAWNSENYQSEPVVVVAQPCYTIGECGEVVGYKPLGLPVRSLRSVSGGVDGVKHSNESDSSLGSRGSCMSSRRSREREFGDIDPSNSENFFNDASVVGLPASPIQWRSRSRKSREKGYGNVTRPMHIRPHSVDETKFEAISSMSLRSTTPFSSHIAVYSSLNSTSSENMNFLEVEMGKEETSYVPASEKMNFQEEDLRQMNTSFVPASEDINFDEEDSRQSKTWYMPDSENMNFQEVDFGKKILRGSSSRKGRMTAKGKHASGSYPSHFRPMSVDETQVGSLTSRSFQSMGSFSPHPSMYSSFDSSTSDNMNFQDEYIEQKKTPHVHASENVNFQEDDMGQKKTFYVHASENVNFQEENLRQRKSRYVHASENMNFQEEHMRPKKNFYVHDSENANFPEENLRQRKTSYVPASENMSFQEEDVGHKKTFYVHASENMNFQEEKMGQKNTSFVPASENMNFQEVDLRKISREPSSRNGSRETKQKSVAVSHPSHFRPMSVDATPFEEGSVNFQEEISGQKNSCYVPSSENRNFQEEDLGKKTSEGPSSRNGRMEGKSAAVSHPSHFRPMSVDEGQFDSLTSHSFRSTGSFSSRTSLCSSASSENMNLANDGFWEKKSSRGSSSSSSLSPARMNHARRYSNESLLQDDIQSNLSDDLKDLNDTQDEDPRGNKESGMHVFLSDSEKTASLPKTPSRGKSVRTRRASGLSSGQIIIGEVSTKQNEVKIEKKPNNVEAVSTRKDKTKSGEPDLLMKGTSKKTLDSFSPPKPDVTFANLRKTDKQEPSKNVSKEDSDIELENIQLSSDEDVVSGHVNDSGLDSEVDKKASEFIAKFKAQIRLQKMGSVDRSKVQKTTGNFVR
ncbi:hypothetical protein TanjilG_24887 [Lupinus angustifolius]|uniref:Uncharacterized protein n=1 Tax=Lupinus angustifolius TaxID=3871 RepID=A0A4P1QZT8_LUPAN|nr:PREDICTED: uncharacterized protein LOC109325855 [Lupinus angustifolius]OIV98716.1 hypothetical protein TanjilG_24887 [Lupinus angustifolius]